MQWKSAPSKNNADKSYAGVQNNGSRWGVKGSTDLSDGLAAVYRFESGINAATDGGQTGRLAYAGLSGGFGTVTMGRVSAAAYSHIAGFTNNAYALGGDGDAGSRIGSAVSYAVSVGSVSLQADVVANKTGGKSDSESATMKVEEDKNVDESHFGMTMQIGDSGSLSLAHINHDAFKDTKKTSSYIGGQYTVGGMTLSLGAGETKFTDKDPAAAGGDDPAGVKTMKTKKTFLGTRGSLGETGVSYVIEFQNLKTSGKRGDNSSLTGTKTTPWVFGLSRSLGGGSAVYFEHSNPDEDKTKSTSVIGLQVNF